MIDTSEILKAFDSGYDSGCLMQFDLFNEKALVPIEDAAMHIATRRAHEEMGDNQAPTKEHDEELLRQKVTIILEKARSDLVQMAEDGLIHLFHNSTFERARYSQENEEDLGVPIYGLERFNFVDELRALGYSQREIRMYAFHEQGLIESVLTTDELAYFESDAQTIAMHFQGKIADEESCDTSFVPESVEELTRLRDKYQEMVGCEDSLGPQDKRRLARVAFHIRFLNDMIRVMLLAPYREMARAGYSSFLFAGYNMRGAELTSVDIIAWGPSLQAAVSIDELANGGDDDLGPVPIRLPGVILLGEQIHTQVTRPSEYEELYKKFDLDQYIRSVNEMNGVKACLNCHQKICESNPRKKFCSERCRNAARQRSYRQKNPEANNLAQAKYLASAYADELGQ